MCRRCRVVVAPRTLRPMKPILEREKEAGTERHFWRRKEKIEFAPDALQISQKLSKRACRWVMRFGMRSDWLQPQNQRSTMIWSLEKRVLALQPATHGVRWAGLPLRSSAARREGFVAGKSHGDAAKMKSLLFLKIPVELNKRKKSKLPARCCERATRRAVQRESVS